MRQKAITKEALLEIANNIIINDDLKSCTIRNISKKAEIGVGTIYNYFPSQKELMEEVFIYSWRVTTNKLTEVLKSESTDKIYDFLSVLDQEVINRKGLGNVIFTGSSSFINDSVFKDLTQMFTDLLEEKGVDDKISSTISPTLLFGLVNKNVEPKMSIDEYYNLIVKKIIE
jgi:AcrR family transcriptional regulator